MSLPLQAAAAVGIAAGAAGLIVFPSKKQKDEAAMDLFDARYDELHPQNQRVAEFKAAHSRWTGFFEKSVYPLTRKLPGNKNPILNPYKDAEPLGGGGDDDE
jgi:hypothetical protein